MLEATKNWGPCGCGRQIRRGDLFDVINGELTCGACVERARGGADVADVPEFDAAAGDPAGGLELAEIAAAGVDDLDWAAEPIPMFQGVAI